MALHSFDTPRPRFRRHSAYSRVFALLAIAGAVLAGCAKDLPTYDELTRLGDLEPTVRTHYKSFFSEIRHYLEAVHENSTAMVDSTVTSRAASAVDEIVVHLRDFPSTVESRLALDALSFAAGDMAASPSFTRSGIGQFWEYGLLDPIFTVADRFVRTGTGNVSSHLQLVRSLQRAMGTRATGEMLGECITLVSPTPPDTVMAVCETDSMVFLRVFELVFYSQSLQTFDPPLWAITGPWLMAVVTEGSPTMFFGIVPVFAGDVPFLAFRTYTQGDVYAAVFDDPVPDDPQKWDAWLERGTRVMGGLTFDRALAEQVSVCELPVHDAHFYYNDYLIHATADTTRKDFTFSLTRSQIQQDTFTFTGADSIAIRVPPELITGRPDGMMDLEVTRWIGASRTGTASTPSRQFTGTAYVMPMGTHDPERVNAYLRSTTPLPEYNVTAVPK